VFLNETENKDVNAQKDTPVSTASLQQ
jgi:hypothetical protein